MDKEDLRSIMIAIVASGFPSEYSIEGIVDRAIAMVDIILNKEDDKGSTAKETA